MSALSVPGGDPGRREAWAQGHLQALVDLYAEGMRAPLPMACATSAAWAGAMYGSGDAEAATRAAEGEWSSTGLVPMERDQPEYVHLYGRWAPLSALMEARPLASEEGPGWPPGRSRFAVLAQRVWEPVLASEKLIRVDAP